jgi:hypothetical protein
MPYLQIQASTPAEQQDWWSPFRKVSRLMIVGCLYGAAFGIMAPASPLLRVSQTNDITALIPRIMGDFFGVGFVSSTISYHFLVERYSKETHSRAADGWLPWLGPATAIAPALTIWVAGHMFYPGQWILFCEPTWRTKMQEFVRLNSKCLLGYAYYHLPPTVGAGAAIGTVMYPYKRYKMKHKFSIDEPTL